MLTVAQPLSVRAASATARRRRLDVSPRAVIPADAVPLINCVEFNVAQVDRVMLRTELRVFLIQGQPWVNSTALRQSPWPCTAVPRQLSTWYRGATHYHTRKPLRIRYVLYHTTVSMQTLSLQPKCVTAVLRLSNTEETLTRCDKVLADTTLYICPGRGDYTTILQSIARQAVDAPVKSPCIPIKPNSHSRY